MFYRAHPFITNRLIVVASTLASIYGTAITPLSYLLLLPFIINVWHEQDVHYETDDWGRRALLKLIISLCIIVSVVGLGFQFGRMFA